MVVYGVYAHLTPGSHEIPCWVFLLVPSSPPPCGVHAPQFPVVGHAAFSPVPPAYAGAPGIHVLPPLFAPVPSVHALPGLKHKTKHQFKNEKKLAKVHTLNKYEYFV